MVPSGSTTGVPVLILASIPSPSSNAIHIGPLQLRAYGVMIALGVLAAVWLTQRRWEQRGGEPDDIARLAMWTVPAGVIGARLYHVITDNQKFRGHWFDVVKIWEGGLGIWGGVALGIVVGVWYARRQGWDVAGLMDAAAPAIPLAQAIGRVGNWFNQELFGRPTNLPWGLEIDVANRPPQYVDSATFHPTFLYEVLWNLLVVALIIWVVPRLLPHLKPGRLMAVYVFLYCVGRLWIELMRSDEANRILGLRVNVWTSTIVGLSALAVVIAGRGGGRSAEPEQAVPPAMASPGSDSSGG
ncbi:MAG TPA: prolipoprotein diacylglyceryl transferase [Acidimicrobiales bacterium]|nr:prolipoprotein diacylglyceryl transferase [Acidimicrobiales bacterium]